MALNLAVQAASSQPALTIGPKFGLQRVSRGLDQARTYGRILNARRSYMGSMSDGSRWRATRVQDRFGKVGMRSRHQSPTRIKTERAGQAAVADDQTNDNPKLTVPLEATAHANKRPISRGLSPSGPLDHEIFDLPQFHLNRSIATSDVDMFRNPRTGMISANTYSRSHRFYDDRKYVLLVLFHKGPADRPSTAAKFVQ